MSTSRRLSTIKKVVGYGLPLLVLSLTQPFYSIYGLAQPFDARLLQPEPTQHLPQQQAQNGAMVQLLQVTQAAQAQVQGRSVLTVKLRDSIGNPLEAVRCEVLSYDWGLVVGQPYSIIARGDTDKTGAVAFDVSAWPRSGYRFKFSKTQHTRPADTFFEDENKNQYRGYPGATVGGRSEIQKFVLSGDGLAYNDISQEGSSPDYAKDPVGGLEHSRVTIMPSGDFLATVAAATATAGARGEPLPTRPKAPAYTPAPGVIQPALNPLVKNNNSTVSSTTGLPAQVEVQKAENKTRGTAGTGRLDPATSAESTFPAAASTAKSDGSSSRASSGATNTSSSSVSPAKVSAEPGSNLLGSALLALLGLTCFGLFWKFRTRLYPWLGIETTPPVQGSGGGRLRQPIPAKAARRASLQVQEQAGKPHIKASEAEQELKQEWSSKNEFSSGIDQDKQGSS